MGISLSGFFNSVFGHGANAAFVEERNDKYKAQGDAYITQMRGLIQAKRGVIPGIERLLSDRLPLYEADGLLFHDGKNNHIINRYWDQAEILQERGERLGTWSQKDGVVAVIDTYGRMFIGPAEYTDFDGSRQLLGNKLLAHKMPYGGWNLPISKDDVAVAPVNYNSLTRTNPDPLFHRDMQRFLGRPAFLDMGQLKKFVNGRRSPPQPYVRKLGQ